MQAVLAYIYSGGTQVAEEDLSSFLAVAEDLQVEGLIKKIPNPQMNKNIVKYSKTIDTDKDTHDIKIEEFNHKPEYCKLNNLIDASTKFDTEPSTAAVDVLLNSKVEEDALLKMHW